MSGPVRLRSKVLRSLHDANAEEAFPHAVYPNASGQGMITRDQPASQPKSIEGLVRRQWRQDGGQFSVHLFSWLIILSAIQDKGILGSGLFLHHHGTGKRVLEIVQGLLG